MKKPPTFPIPPDRYNYFRNELRSDALAREEMMRHIQKIAADEYLRHQEAWDQIAAILGFKDVGELKAKGWEARVDFKASTITLTKVTR